jgi:diadenosine tetraphosphatase ApaH/serine/threonine PP2A family protein phosphatase
MRIAIVSDVHSNMEALEAVLGHAARAGGVDGVWCTGDIVGYGAEPGAVIGRLRELGAVCVAGNHDLVACGKMGVEDFNPVAAEAALWQGQQLGDEERAWLASLPLVLKEGDFTLVHGSLRAPALEYLLDAESAVAQFDRQTTPYSCVGHSHLPFDITESDLEPMFVARGDGETITLGDARLILNSGSVGQPRDGDPRAGYILYDQAEATITWHRVKYDIKTTQAKIVAAGLDLRLAERLALGK